MSDQGTPPPGPYGSSPQGEDPQQPSAGGYPPPPPYGHPQQPGAFPAPYADPAAPVQRPGTVTAGCVMAWIGGGLGVLLGIVLLVAGDQVADQVGAPAGAVEVAGAILAMMSLAALVLAVFAYRRVKGAAIALMVLAIAYLGFGLYSLLTDNGGNPVGGLYSALSAWLVYGNADAKAWFKSA